FCDFRHSLAVRVCSRTAVSGRLLQRILQGLSGDPLVGSPGMILEKETKTAFRLLESCLSLRVAVLAVGWLAFLRPRLAAAGPETATILWRGQPTPVSLAGRHEFQIADVGKALGFEVSTHASTGGLTLTGFAHRRHDGAR